MKTYVVHVYDRVTVYNIEAVNKEEAEEKAKALYRKEKDSWLAPHSVGVVDEYD